MAIRQEDRPSSPWTGYYYGYMTRRRRADRRRKGATGTRAAALRVPDALAALRDAQRRFAAERDWDQYHSPKNLAAALCVEAAELLEHFQWLTDDASKSLSPEQLAKVSEEMADVLLYLVRLSDRLDVNLFDAARRKIELNALKYPAAKARGNNRKYTEL